MKKRLSLLFVMLAVMVTTAFADNVISVSDMKIATTGKADLLINLANGDAIRGVQLTLTLPDDLSEDKVFVQGSENGIAYKEKEVDIEVDKVYTPDDGVKVSLTDDRLSSEDWSVIGRRKSPNTYVFVLISLSGKEIPVGEGSIMKISFQTSAINTGNYQVTIGDIHLALKKEKEDETGDYFADSKLLAINNDFSVLLKGDVNGSGKTTVSDAVCIINYLHDISNEVFYESIANVNMDERITVSDAVSIINILHENDGEASAFSRSAAVDDESDMIDPD